MGLITILAAFAVVYLLLKIVQVVRELRAPPPPEAVFSVGPITLETLSMYNGRDWQKPLLLAVGGTVYDVTDAMDTYAPGKGEFGAYAGREVARAVAKASADASDLGSADVSDLGEGGAARVAAFVAGLKERKCLPAGTIVPMRDVAPEELAASDGSDPARPMLIAIRGRVYDVTKGKDFYGPGGIYPFAGREVARAFALLSTELSDCHDGLEGLGQMELDNLRDWEDKFNWKYPIVGRLSGKALPETAGQKAAGAAAAAGQQPGNALSAERVGAAPAAAAVFGR